MKEGRKEASKQARKEGRKEGAQGAACTPFTPARRVAAALSRQGARRGRSARWRKTLQTLLVKASPGAGNARISQPPAGELTLIRLCELHTHTHARSSRSQSY